MYLHTITASLLTGFSAFAAKFVCYQFYSFIVNIYTIPSDEVFRSFKVKVKKL